MRAMPCIWEIGKVKSPTCGRSHRVPADGPHGSQGTLYDWVSHTRFNPPKRLWHRKMGNIRYKLHQ